MRAGVRDEAIERCEIFPERRRHGDKAAPRRQRHVGGIVRRRGVGEVERGFPAADDDDALSVEDRRLLVVLGMEDEALEGAGDVRDFWRLVQAGADRDAIKNLDGPVGQ